MQQGYGEVGKVRGKMDIFWTSLTRPWWKSSKPKVSGGHILVLGIYMAYVLAIYAYIMYIYMILSRVDKQTRKR